MWTSDIRYEETADNEEVETPLNPASVLVKRDAGTPVTMYSTCGNMEGQICWQLHPAYSSLSKRNRVVSFMNFVHTGEQTASVRYIVLKLMNDKAWIMFLFCKCNLNVISGSNSAIQKHSSHQISNRRADIANNCRTLWGDANAMDIYLIKERRTVLPKTNMFCYGSFSKTHTSEMSMQQNRRSEQLLLQSIVLYCAFPADREHVRRLRPLQTYTHR